MDQFCFEMDNLPLFAKLLLALPGIDIMWNIYRLLRSISANDTLGIVLSVVLLVAGASWVWLFDFIFIACTGKVWWMD